MGVPLAVLAPPPDAERALPFELALGLAPRERLGSSGKTRSGRSQTRCLPLRPATAISPRAARMSSISRTCRSPHQRWPTPGRHHVVLEVAREQRPAGLELSQDVPPEARVLAQEVADPLVALQLAAAPELRHARTLERQVLDRVDEGVVLEQLPLLPEQAVELGGSNGPSRLKRTSCWGVATVAIGSICRKPSRRTVSSTPARRAVEELRPDGDPASLLLPHDPRQRSSLDSSRSRSRMTRRMTSSSIRPSRRSSSTARRSASISSRNRRWYACERSSIVPSPSGSKRSRKRFWRKP